MSPPHDKKILSKQQNKILLEKLIKTAPQLLAKIAPEGFEKSPLFNYYHQTIEDAYRHYRYERALRFKLFKFEHAPDVRNPPLIKFEEFSKTYEPQPHHLPDEIIAILCEQFFYIADDFKIYDQNDQVYDFNDKPTYIEAVDDIVEKNSLSSKDHFHYDYYLNHRFKKPYSIDKYPIYLHIFKFLNSLGHNWQYKAIYLDFLQNLNRELDNKKEDLLINKDNSVGQFESIAQFLKFGETDPEDSTETIYPDFATAFVNYMDEEPDDYLKAYFEAFGHWPKGYPPIMTDYI